MKRRIFVIILSLITNIHLQAQSSQDDYCRDLDTTYHIINVKDYSFNELLNEGIFTLSRQLDILNVPIRKFQWIIKWHIKRHHFALNQREKNIHRTTFRTISFSYPSISPRGESQWLSGLVTFPVLANNKPTRMLIYHRILAPSYKIAPSNSLPIEAVLTADNTICVFPDYYGCGITEGENLPYVSLNYHGQCAAECALAALDIVRDAGIILSDEFYTWNTGYSQGGGYALATHKYIENSLPQNQSELINLKWSLCGDGVYSPAMYYENAILTGNMGSTPTVFLQGLRSLFYGHKDLMGDLSLRDFLSKKANAVCLDSLLLTHDDGLWDLSDKIEEYIKSHDPADYFSPMVLDTSTAQFKTLMFAFNLDDCILNWTPHAPVVLLHSKKDNCVPYQQATNTFTLLSANPGHCFLVNPKKNGTHVFTSILYFSNILHQNEDKLYKKLVESQKEKNAD